MDIRAINQLVRKTDLLNRSGLTMFLIALLSPIAIYYSEAVDDETERSVLMSNLGRYESVLQVEVQHLVDLIYRSSSQVLPRHTRPSLTRFPWVRVSAKSSKKRPMTPRRISSSH